MTSLRDAARRTIFLAIFSYILAFNSLNPTLSFSTSVKGEVDVFQLGTEARGEEKIEALVEGKTAIVAENFKTYDRVSYLGREVPIFISYDTMTDAGSRAGLYNGKFLYGHNSSGVFGALTMLSEGSRISVTLGGKTTEYRVAYKVTLDKDVIQRFMNAIVNARMNGVQYDLALMTCAGVNLGGGDATQRLVVLGERV